jgi:hypothetical protein
VNVFSLSTSSVRYWKKQLKLRRFFIESQQCVRCKLMLNGGGGEGASPPCLGPGVRLPWSLFMLLFIKEDDMLPIFLKSPNILCRWYWEHDVFKD